MPEMPEFVFQLERASGLPWWCLLLLAVLALIIIVLAVALSRAKKRARVAAANVSRATAGLAKEQTGAVPEQTEEAPAAESADAAAQAQEDEGATVDAPAIEEQGVQQVDSASDEASESGEGAADAPEADPAVTEPVSDDSETAPEAVDAEADVTDSTPKSQADEAMEPPNDTPREPESPEVELLEADSKEKAAPSDLADEEIFKATGGSHSRVGQSAFGIDFGFLEEYEEQYERAFEEFRRLRSDLDGKAFQKQDSRLDSMFDSQ